MGETKNIHVTHIVIFPKKANFEAKKMEGSNHFKVHLLESLMWNFDMFALDGAKLYYVKVQEKKQEKWKVCLERYIFEICSQPLFDFLGI